MTRSRMVKVPGVNLSMEDAGSGPSTIVFLHGLGGTIEQWRVTIDSLAPSARVLAYDLRGHGRSSAPRDGDFSAAAMTADLAAVLDAAHVTRATLVGHSLGAAIAAHFARVDSARVAGLILLDPPPGGPNNSIAFRNMLAAMESPAFDSVLDATFAPAVAMSDAATRSLVLTGLRTTPRATIVSALRGLSTFNLADDLRYNTDRLWIVQSNRASAVTQYVSLSAKRERVQMGGTSHWMQVERPAEVVTIIRRFLALQ